MRVKEALLLGGEPTTSAILVQFITYLKTLSLNKIIMTTNGLNLARSETYREKVLGSGLTHLNISLMSLNEKEQAKVTHAKEPLTISDIRTISQTARKHDVKLRINNNIYKGNYETSYSLIAFYGIVKHYADSVKFSPLLKTDAFSVVDFKTEWVKQHILTDEAYDELFANLENYYADMHHLSIITNDEQFGFVKNSMIPLDVPIILNWNQHGQMMNKVVNEHKINNLKILPNGELSLSWNREMTQYFIKTD
jgi:molybdenum cofactor biosynthesis enzyme MoaA